MASLGITVGSSGVGARPGLGREDERGGSRGRRGGHARVGWDIRSGPRDRGVDGGNGWPPGRRRPGGLATTTGTERGSWRRRRGHRRSRSPGRTSWPPARCARPPAAGAGPRLGGRPACGGCRRRRRPRGGRAWSWPRRRGRRRRLARRGGLRLPPPRARGRRRRRGLGPGGGWRHRFLARLVHGRRPSACRPHFLRGNVIDAGLQGPCSFVAGLGLPFWAALCGSVRSLVGGDGLRRRSTPVWRSRSRLPSGRHRCNGHGRRRSTSIASRLTTTRPDEKVERVAKVLNRLDPRRRIELPQCSWLKGFRAAGLGGRRVVEFRGR
jgi:hypothetical protein